VSALFKIYPEIFDSQVKFSVDHQTRFIVTTEGTELVNERLIYGLHMTRTRAPPTACSSTTSRALRRFRERNAR